MKILLANFTKMINDSGGLAKVTCAFANEMAQRGHEVSVLYSDEKKGDFFFPIAAVKLYNLKERSDGSLIKMPMQLIVLREFYRCFDKKAARTVNSRFEERYLLANLQRYLQIIQPDVIVAFQTAATKLLLCDLKSKTPVISMSHGDTEDYFHTYPAAELPALAKAAYCQVLFNSFGENIKRRYPEARIITIGNAVQQFKEQASLAAAKAQYKIIFVGRLNKNHKRPHLLVQAFAQIAKEHPDWLLELWGATERKAYFVELQNLIKAAQLEQQIFLRGTTKKIAEVLREGDIFVQPSAYEGFGLALAEAMSMGMPAIGYKNCPGNNELIEDGVSGFLCADGVEPLAAALERLMNDSAIRIKMGMAAREAMRAYAPEKIWDEWEKLLLECCEMKNVARE